MTPAEFATVRDLLKRRSGLAIDEDKRYLVETRLAAVCRTFGFADLPALVAGLRRRNGCAQLAALEQAVIEAMATNETQFFRDGLPFRQFKDILLPRYREARRRERRLRIWCAAASSGQEPYSLAMLLEEQWTSFAGWRIELLATDISGAMIEQGRSGLYSQFEVQRGLPIHSLLRHFVKEGERWRISEAMRAMVEFRTLNLLEDFGHLGTFDIIFCRNLLIYLDRADREAVLLRLSRALAADGCLVLGGAESAIGPQYGFAPHPEHRGLYFARSPARSTGRPPLVAV